MTIEEVEEKQGEKIMEYIERWLAEAKADEWGEMVEKEFARYGARISLSYESILPDRVIFRVKLKKGTRMKQVFDKASDVQFRVQMPLFIIGKRGVMIYLVMSDRKIEYSHLIKMLCQEYFIKKSKKMKLPYMVGHNIFGEGIMIDLGEQPHILFGGSTNSGKTIGVKALISSIGYWKSPVKVNLILIDVGANDLMVFNSLPHLSCPVIREKETAYQVLNALNTELERRMELEAKDKEVYESLPSLILVIDEFPALFSANQDKKVVRQVTDIISNLLRRGRHVKIHVVLAAQNPTIQNMKVDLGNITTRIAFKCAKRNFSETILGNEGAENLAGRGDLLFKSFQYDVPERMQGVYMTSEELAKIIYRIRIRWRNYSEYNLKFVFNEKEWRSRELNNLNNVDCILGFEQEEILFSQAVLWAISQNKISCNLLMKKFGLGWNRANEILEKLNRLGIVATLDAKLPRRVIVDTMEDVSEEVLELLRQNGIGEEKILEILQRKNE